MSRYRRLSGLLRNDRLGDEIDAELWFHLQERMDALVEEGCPRAEAESRARRQFGNLTSHKEKTRDADIVGWVESIGQDIRYAMRAFRKNPAFTATAALSLALAIDANTAIFSLLNSLFLNPLPVRDSSHLAAIYALENNHTGKTGNLPRSPIRT